MEWNIPRPDDELPKPIEPTFERVESQYSGTQEIPVSENRLAAEAISRQPQFIFEHTARAAEIDQPIEKLHELRAEVKDESSSSPVVSVGSLVSEASTRLPITPNKKYKSSNDNISKSQSKLPKSRSAGPLKEIWAEPLFRRAIFFGFGTALAMAGIIFIWSLT